MQKEDTPDKATDTYATGATSAAPVVTLQFLHSCLDALDDGIGETIPLEGVQTLDRQSTGRRHGIDACLGVHARLSQQRHGTLYGLQRDVACLPSLEAQLHAASEAART